MPRGATAGAHSEQSISEDPGDVDVKVGLGHQRPLSGNSKPQLRRQCCRGPHDGILNPALSPGPNPPVQPACHHSSASLLRAEESMELCRESFCTPSPGKCP